MENITKKKKIIFSLMWSLVLSVVLLFVGFWVDNVLLPSYWFYGEYCANTGKYYGCQLEFKFHFGFIFLFLSLAFISSFFSFYFLYHNLKKILISSCLFLTIITISLWYYSEWISLCRVQPSFFRQQGSYIIQGKDIIDCPHIWQARFWERESSKTGFDIKKFFRDDGTIRW